MSGIFGSGSKSQAQQAPAYSGVQLQNSSYGRTVPIVYGTIRVAPNIIWYGNFRANGHVQKSGKGGGGGGGKGGGGSVTYTYSTAVAMALSEGPVQGVGRVFIDKEVKTIAALGFSFFNGDTGQAPWPWLQSYAPAEALAYKGLAYVAAPSLDLGNNPNLGNHNFEVQGHYANSISGQVDADPSLVIVDMLTNPVYGAGFPAGRIGNLADYQDYALASGLWVSVALTEANEARTVLEDIAKYTNSAFVWSEGVLNLVPYGDQAITANGHTYTPPSEPLFDLTDDDFLAQDGEPPVTMVRKRPSDVMNQVQLEYLDRANEYNTSVAEAKDQSAIDVYGLRGEGSMQAHVFCDAAAANTSAQLLLQRQAVRNQYTFRTDIRYIVLDPMDIITITDDNLGLDRQWVRVVEMAQSDDGTLEFTVEEYLAGTGTSAANSFQQGQGYAQNYNAPPGDVNPPIMFEAPVQIATTGLETWFALSGGDLWGGADIYLSTDGDTYELAGQQVGPARMGVLTADLPASALNPDEANTLAVDISEAKNSGDILSGTTEDANLLVTLCYVDGELLAYRDATLTGEGQYSLTYLNRGGYGTKPLEHLEGTQFARLDGAIYKYTYDKELIGKTVYLKFCSFNIWGGGLQSLADVTAYPHVVVGPPLPSDVTGFNGQQNGNVVALKWDHVRDFALKGFDIGYAAAGVTDWARFTLLSEVEAGTEMTNASVPPGTWTFGIRARDVADQLSPNPAFFTLTVTNPNDIIDDYPENPRWQGTLSGMYKHDVSNNLVLATLNANSVGDDFAVFDNFLQNPVAEGYYEPAERDLGFLANDLRIYGVLDGTTGPNVVGTPEFAFQLAYAGTDGVFNSFADWVLGTLTARYLKFRAVMRGSAVRSVLQAFMPVVDASTRQETGTVTVPVGGILVPFAQEFHFVPNVQVSPVGATPLIPNRPSTTRTGFYVQLFNTAGVDVGGVADWTATGV